MKRSRTPIRDPLRERARISGPFLLIVMVVLASAGFAFYEYLEERIIDSLGRQAETMASVTAKLVEMNLTEYRRLRTEADQERRFYLEMKELFRRMKSADFIRFVYTERRVSDSGIVYVLDSEDPDSPDASPIGQPDDLDALGRKVFETGKSSHSGIVADPRWGSFITGYAPIRDPSSGGIEGIAGVDVAAATVGKMLRGSALAIAVACAAIFALAMLPLIKLGRVIARQMRTDPLTAAIAKKAIAPDLERAAARSRATGLPLAVIILDLDHFKRVNDAFGHQIGDLVLREDAQAMRAALRYDDRLYRYGGEEFLLLMLGPPEARAMEAAEAMRARVEALRVSVGDGAIASATVSVGVAFLEPGESPGSALGRADDAMYESKRQGRNRITMAPRLGPSRPSTR